MRKFQLLLLVFFTITANAQEFTGCVFTLKDRQPLEFATVVLQQLPDSSIVKGVLTQSSGRYIFENIVPDKYYLSVSYNGFQKQGKQIVINKNTTSCDTIFLSEMVNKITEITVTGNYIKGTEQVDRTVYRVPKAVAETSINGFEVLRKIPSVQVDFNNNIKLNGSTNFIINVDGKIRNKEFIAKLLPSDIESIEIINDPSGKYDGNIDGVINILLKKEKRIGISGNIQLIKKTSLDLNGGTTGSLDYGFKKISFYITGNSFIQNLNTSSASNYKYYYKGIENSVSKLCGDGELKINTTTINTGFDYYINDKNTLSFNFSFKPLNQDLLSENVGSFKGIDSLNTSIINPTSNKITNQENVFSLFYQKKYDNPIQELTMELRYYDDNLQETNDYKRLYYHLDTLLDNSIVSLENKKDKRSAYTGKIDYVYPFNMFTKLELGYQLFYQAINYNYTNNEIEYKPFQYSELRNAGYTGITFKKKKWAGLANIRLEHSLNDINKNEQSNYICILPSTSVQYKINGKQNIKANYNRRINRPGINNLYPYVKISDFQFSQGNPYLEPEYSDKFQLTYSLNFNSNFISTNIYYTKFSDKIGIAYKYIESNSESDESFIVSYPKNLLNGFERGIGLNATLKFLNINARLYQGHLDEYKEENIEAQKYSSFSVNGYLYSKLPFKMRGFAYFNYDGVDVNLQSKIYNTPFYGFGAQKNIGNHTLGFFYLLPFSKNVTVNRTETYTSGFNSKTTFDLDLSYFIQIMYSYRFNNGKSVKKTHREIETEDNFKTKGVNSNLF